ncbi:GntR family transcriptional regulator [Clostridium peptidivorans]|uniref:GntR family transcriptional regulator n=1 Tax=Clostridium peptidivorans TaxID=100174 RepID=UPI000BE27055|nr:GntR family transcriptional regulator [Clostridium peptidivorans]
MIIIDSRSSTPIYEQIIIKIKELILKGVLEPGDKLPSVRELSGIITANPNTVSKAYAELERQKVIETIRGRGTFVAENYKPKIQEDRMEALKEDLKKVILEAKYMGLTKDELVDIMDTYYEELSTSGEEGKN